jgi:hypothetical protein
MSETSISRWRRSLPWTLAAVALALLAASGVVEHSNEAIGVHAVEPWVTRLTVGGLAPIVVLAVAGLVNTAVRYRRAVGVERQQIKWLVPPILLLPIVLLLTGFAATEPLGLVLGAVVTTSIPVGIGVAVLRYRLYEIDRVISRTLAYAALTIFLVAVYTAGVLGLGWLARSVAAGGGGDIAVAASTLAVAALFGPARRRIQATVDRRFNRARYDAQRTVEAFAQRLRDEVDIDALTDHLRDVTDAVMQPRQVIVWVADPTGGRP